MSRFNVRVVCRRLFKIVSLREVAFVLLVFFFALFYVRLGNSLYFGVQ